MYKLKANETNKYYNDANVNNIHTPNPSKSSTECTCIAMVSFSVTFNVRHPSRHTERSWNVLWTNLGISWPRAFHGRPWNVRTDCVLVCELPKWTN